jgi:hypothetical protein
VHSGRMRYGVGECGAGVAVVVMVVGSRRLKALSIWEAEWPRSVWTCDRGGIYVALTLLTLRYKN